MSPPTTNALSSLKLLADTTSCTSPSTSADRPFCLDSEVRVVSQAMDHGIDATIGERQEDVKRAARLLGQSRL